METIRIQFVTTHTASNETIWKYFSMTKIIMRQYYRLIKGVMLF